MGAVVTDSGSTCLTEAGNGRVGGAVTHEVALNLRRLVLVLATGAVVLVAAHLAGLVLKHSLGHPSVYGLVAKFDLDAENNVPAWFSSVLLFIAAGLFWAIARAKTAERDRFAPHWNGLWILFLAASMDEVASFHERLSRPVQELLPGIGGVLQWPWVIAGALFVAMLAITYWRFLLSLPPRSRRLFWLAAILFVGGALGVETTAGFYLGAAAPDNDTLDYELIATVEEVLEHAGVIVLIQAAADYIARMRLPLRLAPAEAS